MSNQNTASGPEFYFTNVGNTDAVNIVIQFGKKSYSPASAALLSDPREDIRELRAHPQSPAIAGFLSMERNREQLALQGKLSEDLRLIREDIMKTEDEGKPHVLVMNLSHNGVFGRKYELASTSIGDVVDHIYIMIDWDDVLPIPRHHTNDMCFVLGHVDQPLTPCLTTAK